jgi:hypothetical protein
MRMWMIIPLTLLAAYAVSYFWCAATLLYLAVRRVNDGQDMNELWTPGGTGDAADFGLEPPSKRAEEAMASVDPDGPTASNPVAGGDRSGETARG